MVAAAVAQRFSGDLHDVFLNFNQYGDDNQEQERGSKLFHLLINYQIN